MDRDALSELASQGVRRLLCEEGGRFGGVVFVGRLARRVRVR